MSTTTEVPVVNDHRAAVMCSFMLGAMAGTGLALLLAPASGRDTRARLAGAAKKGRDQTAEMLERGRGAVTRARACVGDQTRHASRAVAEGRQALSDMRDRGTQALGTIGQEMTAAVADARAAYKDERSRPADRRDRVGEQQESLAR
jgi:gas vesicle protein